MSASGASEAPRARTTEVTSSPLSQAVARYYDATTRLFLRADTTRSGTLHRRLWAPGVTSARAAAEYVHGMLAQAIGAAARDVLDLGSGVGATCLSLAETRGLTTTGVTISEVQCALSQEAARRRGLERRCRFLHADFMHLDAALPEAAFDAAFGIEAFIHAEDGGAFFGQVARVLRPGGRLFLCDDFLTPRAPSSDPVLVNMRRGWHANSLLTPAVVAERAAAHGLTLVGDQDLTPHLRLSPELVLSVLAVTGDALAALPGVGASGFVHNWIGGTALQQCQRRGWTEYRFLSFERR